MCFISLSNNLRCKFTVFFRISKENRTQSITFIHFIHYNRHCAIARNVRCGAEAVHCDVECDHQTDLHFVETEH